MAGQELTHNEVLVLAGAFPVPSAKTLLSLARFPPWAIPETGYGNSREFWIKISEQLEAGAMPDGRRKILETARDWFPANETLAALAAAAPLPPGPSAPAAMSGAAGQAVTVTGGQGIQIGSNNTQINYANAGPVPRPETPQASPQAALRVLVIGASPLDPDLPHVRTDREAHAIERAAAPDWVEVKVVLGAEATDLQWVGTFRPDIVHFVCHGTADSLVFSDKDGESHYVTAADVAQRLRFYRDERGVRLRGIVLAACDGETLAPSFAGVADTVIAHRGKLADPCGVAFAAQFYSLLNAAQGGARRAARAQAPDLAGVAREAAQLTAQFSAACDPVITRLIVSQGGG
jgi:Effector-associated domain 1/CHAT domain/RIP homotypic interaction motif